MSDNPGGSSGDDILRGIEEILQEAADKRVCVLMSGGLDSCVLASAMADGARSVHPIYIRSNLIWEATELHWVQRFLAALASPQIQTLKILEMPVGDVYRQHWSLTGDEIPDHSSTDEEVYLPGRNLLLLSKATLFCALNQIPLLAIGILKGNPFPDATEVFFSQYAKLASQALDYGLMVLTPFSSLSKMQVIRLGQDLPLHLSFSCIHPKGLTHCGSCNKCAERRRSFRAAGIPDRTEYHSLPELMGHSS